MQGGLVIRGSKMIHFGAEKLVFESVKNIILKMDK